MKKWIFIFFTIVLSFLLGAGFFIRYDNYFGKKAIIRSIRKYLDNSPLDRSVQIDSTSLPVIKLYCKKLEREHFVSGKMSICSSMDSDLFDSSVGGGNILIKYRGSSSWHYHGAMNDNIPPKKSFTICTLDDAGQSTNFSFFGMRRGKKWALQAQWYDRSKVRQILTYDLLRPVMAYVPEGYYCEVFINEVYYGVYLLTEIPNRKRMGIGKDGQLIYCSHPFPQNEHWTSVMAGDTMTCYYELKYPKVSRSDSMFCKELNINLSQATMSSEDTLNHSWMQYIDTDSFIDYQLICEFSKNIDAYYSSAYIYKDSEIDSLYRIVLWDADLTYGVDGWKSFRYTDEWVYDEGRGGSLWWKVLMQDKLYSKKLSQRWKSLRKNAYSDKRIFTLLDSLSTLLQTSGAIDRDSQAWGTFSSSQLVEKNPSYRWTGIAWEDEIAHLRHWIGARLRWMDEQLK